MQADPFQVVRDFEKAIAAYCGAKEAISCASCTAALLLALLWVKRKRGPLTITIPKRTYIGVGMSILNAGHDIAFDDRKWLGWYRLEPLELWDSARFLSGGMCDTLPAGYFVCLSLHWSKTLSVSQGGVILCDNAEAADFLRRARFDGRREGVHPKDDTFDILGQHCYMAPATAAEALTRLALLPRINMPLPNSDYSDISLAPIFQSQGKTPA